MATIKGLAEIAVGAGDSSPDAVLALQNALQGLGNAYVEFGKAVLAIDVKKAAQSGDGKKKRVRAAPAVWHAGRAPPGVLVFFGAVCCFCIGKTLSVCPWPRAHCVLKFDRACA